MIKLFENVSLEKLEEEVNEYIKTCDSKIHEVQYRTTDGEEGIYFTICIIHDLDFQNAYK